MQVWNTIRNVQEKLEEYCKEIAYKRKNRNLRNNVPIEEEEKRPDQNWAQCDKCQQWRRMPDGINNDKLPEEWFCYMNPDPQFRHCETMEEPEDSDSEQPTNKTYKIHEKEEKKKQEDMKEFKKFQEEKRQQELLLKAEARRREMRKTTSTPNTPQTPGKGASASGVSTRSSQPVITDVISLSKTPSRLKRLQPTTPQNESKRQKLDGLKRKLVTDMSLSSSTTPPTPVPYKDLNIDDDLLEGSSTPAPTEPTLHPVGVRTESDPMDSAYVAFTSPRKSFVDEPTVNYTRTQMRDEMRDKSIQIWDEEEEEVEMRDKSIQIWDEEEEEEMRDKSIQIWDEEEDEEMRDKSTQMQGPRVKDEEEEMRDKSIQIWDEEMRDKSTQMQGPRVKDEMEEMRDKSPQMQGPRVKDEEEMNSSTAANDGAQGMEEGMISIIQAQEEQDQLMELLQSVSNERDSFKEKVKELHAQLELEKQCADCQTAREKAEKLSREKEDLTCRLDQSSKEMEKLHLKVCWFYLVGCRCFTFS
ncbi:unnamed protein product [Arctogadus glacialis]